MRRAVGAVMGYAIGVVMRAPTARFIIAYGNAMDFRGNAMDFRGNAIDFRGNAIDFRGNAMETGHDEITRAEGSRHSGCAWHFVCERHRVSVNPIHIVHRIVSGIFSKISGIRPEMSWRDDAPLVRRCI